MLDELRDRIFTYLARNRVCVIATRGSNGAWAVPVQYEFQGLALNCLLPRWSDAFFHIEQDPHVMAIVLEGQSMPMRWLQYRGIARIGDSTDERYVTIHITPQHIDLIDESRGWGARETYEI